MNKTERQLILAQLRRRHGKRNKLGAKGRWTEDGYFPSLWELACWREKQQEERAGTIHRLKRQVRFPLYVGDQVVGHYTADFVYATKDEEPVDWDAEPPTLAPSAVVADAKGMETNWWKRQAKHFRACYGRDIVVLKRKGRRWTQEDLDRLRGEVSDG